MVKTLNKTALVSNEKIRRFRMSTSVIFCLMFALTAPVEISGVNRGGSEWNFHTIRRRTDILIVLKSVHAESLIGCVSFCSKIGGIIVPSLYFTPESGNCTCNSATDEATEDENEPSIVYGTRISLQQTELTNGQYTRTTIWPYRHDCFDLFEDMHHDDGVYVIHPPGGNVTDTWCDMNNGGWTVIQRRMDGSEEFYRGWDDYVTGFGNRTGEYWLGLENIHQLTKNGSELIVYMEAYPGVTPASMTAHYSNFKIGDIVSEYTLYVSGFSGTCGDSFTFHNGQPFTTLDNDNDNKEHNCAVRYKGAWWYRGCHNSQLNGLYFMEGNYNHLDTDMWATGIHWYQCWGREQSSKFSLMKVRRNPF